MSKILKQIRRQDREKLRAYKTVQQTIPLEQVYDDGIFCVQKGKKESKFSVTFRLRDISYQFVSDEAQRNIFLIWSAALNSLTPGTINNISIIKHRLGARSLDGFLLDTTHLQNHTEDHRLLVEEMNHVLMQKASQGNGMVQELYVTVSVNKRDIEAARNFFRRTQAAMQAQLSRTGSQCDRLSSAERLRLLHDFYRIGLEDEPPFDLKESLKHGSSAKNYIAPESLEFFDDYFKMGDKSGRALVLHTYPTFLKDTIVSELCDLNAPLIWSMNVIPVPTNEAVEEAQKRAMNAESNLQKWYRKQYENKNYGGTPPYDLEQQRVQAQEYLKDLTERDQHLMYAVITMVHLADTKEQLDNDTESLEALARTAQCRLATLKWQQMDGLNTALPFGVRRVEDIFTLTTEGVAGFMPFRSTEIQDPGGLYFGQNQVSKNLIMINLKRLQSANSIICGIPGSGKSFFAKRTALNRIFAADENQEIIFIDPEREYFRMLEKLDDSTVIRLSAVSDTHINAMEIGRGYTDGDDPLIIKSEFMTSLCEQLVLPAVLGPHEKSLIDRCTSLCLSEYIRGGCTGEAPTLLDFYQIMLEQPEPQAKGLALAIEMFAKGNMNAFAQQTNVDINSRIICYDTLDLGDSMKTIGLLVLFDNIMNRISRNRARGIRTSIICDEFYLMLQQQFTADFFYKMWKRCRKYGADFCGITQNVDDLLHNPVARTILSNSEILVMLNQAASDRELLADLLDISESQLEYITNAKAGYGLLRIGGEMIPFEDDFPKDTGIYKLLTTKPDEIKSAGA